MEVKAVYLIRPLTFIQLQFMLNPQTLVDAE